MAFNLIEKSQRGEVLPTKQEMEDNRRMKCDFDLCSDCVKKNNDGGSNNVCRKGHQLYPVTVNADGWHWRRWHCSGKCGYRWNPYQGVEQDVLVWRCEYDKRLISLETDQDTGTRAGVAGNYQEEDKTEQSDPSDITREDSSQTSYSNSPLHDVSQETDISPSSSQSPSREESGLPYGLDLERLQAVQLCTVGPPHCCEEYYDNCTDEEGRQMDQWIDQCEDQIHTDSLRPDIECDEDGALPYSFWCSILQELRRS